MKGRSVGILFAALALTAAAPSPEAELTSGSAHVSTKARGPIVATVTAEEPLPHLPRPAVSMEKSAWSGRLIFAFRIDAQGDGEYRDVKKVDGFYSYDVRIRPLHVGPDGFARLRDVVGSIPEPTTKMACGTLPPNRPRVVVRWAWPGASGELQVLDPCPRDTRRARRIQAIAAMVKEWAASAAVARIEQVRMPTPEVKWGTWMCPGGGLVEFEPGTARITPNGDQMLRTDAKNLKSGNLADGWVNFEAQLVNGADARERRLAEERAEAIRQRLRQLGVGANKVFFEPPHVDGDVAFRTELRDAFTSGYGMTAKWWTHHVPPNVAC